MLVNYVGGKWRQAFISFYEDEEDWYTRTRTLLEAEGWEIETCDWTGSCQVFDKEEYDRFMEDWKRCKKIAKEQIREEKKHDRERIH